MELVPGNDDVRATGPGVKLTYDDFVLFPDDGKRHELIDGEHYVTPSPNTKHQKVSGNLFLLIGTWLEQHRIGQLFFAPFDVVFSQFDVVEPDLQAEFRGIEGFRGTEGSSELTFKWFSLDRLHPERIEPAFLREALRHLPRSVTHLIQRG